MSALASTDFAEDRDFVDRFQRTMRGDLELGWMDAARERVACRPQNARRGLTFRDLDVGAYGFTAMPEVIRDNRSFAPRGAAMPDGLPDLQAEVNRKSDVWAYNVEGYYEEAMSRQWNTTTDIPWADLDRIDLPADFATRLMELGFLPGSSVTAARCAPGGDPRVFRVDGSEVALRKDTAARLLLKM